MFKTNDYWEEEFREYNIKELDSIYFDCCTFINCDFSKASFYDCKFIECVFTNCDLSLSTFKSSIFILLINKVRTRMVFTKLFLKKLINTRNRKHGQVPSQNMVMRGYVSMLIYNIYVYNSYAR